jgi:hypothetical protein
VFIHPPNLFLPELSPLQFLKDFVEGKLGGIVFTAAVDKDVSVSQKVELDSSGVQPVSAVDHDSVLVTGDLGQYSPNSSQDFIMISLPVSTTHL